MDDTQQSRTSDANATRKRRSSILKSQRPPRTPFSELEFNVATPTDTGKSRRVSFSRRTGVAEFVTNEATTTWKNFYEEHNKSLDSSGNESGANPSRQTVGHLGNRIFDQQFQDCEAIDLNPGVTINNSLNNFPQQLSVLDCDDKLTGPQNNFELSALTDHQSKLFGNDFNAPTMGEMSGRIDINFSAVQQIGGDGIDDLDEIQKDLQRVSTNFVCPGPMSARPSLSEYIEVDLNMTHVTVHNEESDMSITDTVHSPKVQDVSKSSSIEKKVDLNKDWVADKENIAINPYVAPKESANFALNEKSDKVLVFDGKRLTLQSDRAEKDANYRQTLIPNLPQRKTVVLNTDDDLPNFVDNPLMIGTETSSISGVVEMSGAVNNDFELSMTAPVCRTEVSSKRRTILDNANISMTQALPSNIVTKEINVQRKSVLYGDDAGNISLTKALPAQILTNNLENNNYCDIPSKRTTIFDSSVNISMTQALPSNIMGGLATDSRKSIIYDAEDGNISITRALPAHILTNIENEQSNKCDGRRRTILDNSGNISITQAVPSNIISEAVSRRSVMYDNDGDISITRALPGNILTSDATGNECVTKGDARRRTILDNSGNISMTQMLPSNIIAETITGNRKSVIFDAGNESKKILDTTRKTIIDESGNISITKAVPTNILTMDINDKRKSIMYGDEGNMSVTQALPVQILNTFDRKHRTITYDDDTGDISVTKAVPVTINEERRKTVLYGTEIDNISFTQAIPTNIVADKRRRTVVFEDDACDISMTQSIPSNIILTNKPQANRRTILYEDGNISVTQTIPNVILAQNCGVIDSVNVPKVTSDTIVPEKFDSIPDIVVDKSKNNVSLTRVLDYDESENNLNKDTDSTTRRTVHEYDELNALHDKSIKSNRTVVYDDGNISDINIAENRINNKTMLLQYDIESLSITKSGKSDLEQNLQLPRNKHVAMKLNPTLDESQIYGRTNLPVVQAYHANVTLTDPREHALKENTVFLLAENASTAKPTTDVISPKISEADDKSVISDTEEPENSNPERENPGTAKQNNRLSVAYALLAHINSNENLEENMEVELTNTDDDICESVTVKASNEQGNVIDIKMSLNNKSINESATLSNASVPVNDNVISEFGAENVDFRGGLISVAPALINNIISAENIDDTTDRLSHVSVYHERQNMSVADALLANITSFEAKETSLDNLENYESEKQDDMATQKDSEQNFEFRKSVSFVLPEKETQKDLEPGMESNENLSIEADKETQVNDKIEIIESNDIQELEPFKLSDAQMVENKSEISVSRASISSLTNVKKQNLDTGAYEGDNASLATSPAKLNLTGNEESSQKEDNEEPIPVKGQLAIENKSIPEPRRLSFAPSRLSIVLSREDMLNNISMAQAVLQKSRIEFNDTEIVDDTKDTIDDSSVLKKSVRMSNEVVKTLHFEDESYSESSIKSDIKASPLKKTAFGETSYMKESKAKVIPTFLKDVSDGIKELMSDLVKPMTDVLPFDAAGLDRNVKKSVSVCSTQVQANLITSSQIDMDCELYSNAESCYNISTSRSTQKTVSEPSVKSLKVEKEETILRKPAEETVRGHVLVFDQDNPLNNVLIGPMDGRTHKYNPGSESTTTLCGEESDQSKTTVNTEKGKEYEVERVSLQYNVESRLSHAMEGDACSDPIPEMPVTLSNTSKPSIDQSVNVKQDVTNTEVNTLIAMKDNKELLDAHSSLTLVDETLSNIGEKHLETIPSQDNLDAEIIDSNQDIPIRSIPIIEEQETDNQDSEMTSNDEDIASETSKRTKRSYSATKYKHSIINMDMSPKQIIKMQKLSTSPHFIKTMLSPHHATKKTLEKLATGQYVTKMDVDERSQKKSPLKIKSKKPNTNARVQQVITDFNLDTKEYQNGLIDMVICESDGTEPKTQSEVEESKSVDIVSSTASEKFMGGVDSSTASEKFMKGVDSSTASVSRSSAMQSVSRIDWHPELIHELSSKDMVSECDSGVNVVAKIDMLPFMGSYECEWESSSADAWSFRLLHGRVRLAARLARAHVRPGTALHSVTVEQLVYDKKNPVALLCVRFACEAMRYVCGRGARAADMPLLLRRCAAVARVALRWGRAMQDARAQLAYTLDNDGQLTLKVANIPLRSVWEVRMRIELVVEDARETPWPRAERVRVEPVLADGALSEGDVRRALASVPGDWGHVPRTVWKIFRYLKHKTRDDDLLLGL